MWRFILLISTLQYIRCSCPSGFQLVHDQCRGKYARIDREHEEQALNNAIAECNQILSQPVIIHDEEQQTYWKGRCNETVDYFFVIGLVCNSHSKRWEWVDGSAVDYKPPAGKYDSDLDGECKSGCEWFLYPEKNSDGSDFDYTWYESCEQRTFTSDVFCIVPPRQPVSPNGCYYFDDDSEDGVCYQVGATAETWQEAQMNCKNIGANLASIHNQQENTFVRRLAVSKGAVNGLFLGATLSGKGKDFGWVDGSEWDYEYFYPGFPIPASGECLAMDTSTPSGQWINFDCSQKLPVACMRSEKEVIATCSTGPWDEGSIITSPGFPYNASIPCDYFFSVDDGKIIEAEIVFLEANPCCDHLVIHDRFLGEGLIANITGEVRNATYTSTSNLMRVSWQPNGGENVRGMAISYRGV